MQREAERLGVRGWVRNRRDGSVEALAHGDAAAVERLIEWARRGPPGARVMEVQASSAADEPGAGFDIRTSA
jgi:acylphosphatase